MSRKSNHTGLKAVLILLILVLLAGSILMVKLSLDLAGAPVETKPSASVIELPTASEAETVPETEPTTVPTEPEPEKIIATATIRSQGDLLMHSPVFNSCKQADGTYDFESIFRYTKDTLASVVQRYTLQVNTYAEALSRIYELPVKRKYLYFFRLNRFVMV